MDAKQSLIGSGDMQRREGTPTRKPSGTHLSSLGREGEDQWQTGSQPGKGALTPHIGPAGLPKKISLPASPKRTGEMPLPKPTLTDSQNRSLCKAISHRENERCNGTGKSIYLIRQSPYQGIDPQDESWQEIYLKLEAAARPMSDDEYKMFFGIMSVRLGIKTMSKTQARIFHTLDKQAYRDSKISYYAAYHGFIDLLRTKVGMNFVPIPAAVIAAGMKYQREINLQIEPLRDIFTNILRIESR